jgi:hypothetical protein
MLEMRLHLCCKSAGAFVFKALTQTSLQMACGVQTTPKSIEIVSRSYLTMSLILVLTAVPVTVAAQSKACTVFACSNAGIAGSNPTRGMDVCVRLLCSLFVLFCV